MPPDTALNLVQLFVVLVAAAAAAAFIVRRFGVPYTAVLVVIGLAGAILAPGLRVVIPPDLILAVFLPGLVFESAYRLDLAQLRRRSTIGPVFLLTIPGVVFSAAVVAWILQAATGLPFPLGFIVGAMLSATDAAAVIAVVKRLRAPAQLTTLIEAESLFNDGTAIVIFGVALAGLGGQFNFAGSAIDIVLAVGVSSAVGLIGGLIASRLMALLDDHLIELSVTLVLAYGTYLVADAFHESGIIATVIAALVLGNYGRRHAMTARGEDAVDTVWEFVAFLLSALLFLLIGFSISVPAVVGAAVPIVWGIVGILVGRAVLVYAGVGLGMRFLRSRPRALNGSKSLTRGMPAGWLHVILVAGLRGAVSVALALSLPADIPQRDLLVDITFGIVAFTLIVQALTIDFVVERSLSVTMRPPNPESVTRI